MCFVSWPAEHMADARVSNPTLRAGATVAADGSPAGGDSAVQGSIPPGGEGVSLLAGGVAAGTEVQAALIDWLRFCRQYHRLPAGGGAAVAAERPAERAQRGAAAEAATAKEGEAGQPARVSHSGCPDRTSPDASPAVHRAMREALAALAREAGGQAPLVVLAHATGCVPAVLFLSEMQRGGTSQGGGGERGEGPVSGAAANESERSEAGEGADLEQREADPELGRADLEHVETDPEQGRTDLEQGRTDLEQGTTDLEQGKTLCSFVTAGCPLPLYLSQLHPPMPPHTPETSLAQLPPPRPPTPPPLAVAAPPSSHAGAPPPPAAPTSPPPPACAAPLPWLPPPLVPSPALSSSCPHLALCPTEALGWLNYFHPSDPLAYPLAPLFDMGSPAVHSSQGWHPTHNRSESAPPTVSPPSPLPEEAPAASGSQPAPPPTALLPPPFPTPGRVIDTPVRSHRWTSASAAWPATRSPHQYLARPVSRDVLSPLAHSLVLIWLASNPTVAATLNTAPLTVHREHRSRMRARVGKQMSKRGAAVAAAASRTTQALYTASRRSDRAAEGAGAAGEGRRRVGPDPAARGAAVERVGETTRDSSFTSSCSGDAADASVAKQGSSTAGGAASSAGRARAAARAAGSATLRSIRTLDVELHKVGGFARKPSFGRRSRTKPPAPATATQNEDAVRRGCE